MHASFMLHKRTENFKEKKKPLPFIPSRCPRSWTSFIATYCVTSQSHQCRNKHIQSKFLFYFFSISYIFRLGVCGIIVLWNFLYISLEGNHLYRKEPKNIYEKRNFITYLLFTVYRILLDNMKMKNSKGQTTYKIITTDKYSLQKKHFDTSPYFSSLLHVE